MSNGLSGIISALESLAEYTGPWRPLRSETKLLQTRLDELREREQRLDDVLLVALVGGSGVGKSTLLNALAGDQIAETSEMRPCTSAPTVYHPPGMQFNLAHLSGVKHVSRSALEHIALIDTPDSDTIVKEHRRIVEQVLQECDLILLCADSEKYLDEATWSLLQPLQGLRAIVCVETRVARPDDAIKNHWMKKLREYGFHIEQYFRVNALRALDRKLHLAASNGDEFDFGALERFLRHELDRERVARIKSSNAAGLLAQTVTRLNEQVTNEASRIAALKEAIAADDETLARITMKHFTAGALAEAHLWVQALGREVGLRAKGAVGTVYKLLELLRSLPYRLPVWLSFDVRRRADELAAHRLFAAPGAEQKSAALPQALLERYGTLRSELRLRFIRAGFDMPEGGTDEDFQEELNRRVRLVFDGSVNRHMAKAARLLSAWPVVFLLDGLPLAFLGYTGYLVVHAYWRGDLLPTASFLHVGVVFMLLIAVELMLMALGVRIAAWYMRRKGIQVLKQELAAPGLAFKREKKLIAEVEELTRHVTHLYTDVTGGEASPAVNKNRHEV